MSTQAPIKATDPWGERDFDLALTHDEPEEIRDLLVGHRVTKVFDDHLLLDDGTLLKLVGNEGGCACSAGDYGLTELNEVENVITSVEFEDAPGGDDAPCRTCGETWCFKAGHDAGYEGHYKIFVFADAKKINLATFEGSDGNGYYGTGYHILVRKPKGEDIHEQDHSMSDIREALVALIPPPRAPEHVDHWPQDEQDYYRHGDFSDWAERLEVLDRMRREKVADAILAEFDVTPRGEDRWEYGVKWGDEPDDSRPSLCDSRAHAESRAAASHGDKIVRRTKKQVIPAGPWKEVPSE